MMLSTRGRYAVMAMVDLAACQAEQPVTLAEISERQEIPLAYLEQIFAKLRKGGLIASVRGPGGGYRLKRPAAEVRISEIISAAEESIKMTRCDRKPESGCMTAKTRCLTHDLWDGLGAQIHRYLDSITLKDVCAGTLRQEAPGHGRVQRFLVGDGITSGDSVT